MTDGERITDHKVLGDQRKCVTGGEMVDRELEKLAGYLARDDHFDSVAWVNEARAEIRRLQSRAQLAEAQSAAMAEALRPFADEAATWTRDETGELQALKFPATGLHAKDFLHARSALSSLPQSVKAWMEMREAAMEMETMLLHARQLGWLNSKYTKPLAKLQTALRALENDDGRNKPLGRDDAEQGNETMTITLAELDARIAEYKTELPHSRMVAILTLARKRLAMFAGRDEALRLVKDLRDRAMWPEGHNRENTSDAMTQAADLIERNWDFRSDQL